METRRSEEPTEKTLQTTVNATSRYEPTYTTLSDDLTLQTSSRYTLSNPTDEELYANNIIKFSLIKVEHGVEIIMAEGTIIIHDPDYLTEKEQEQYRNTFESSGDNQGEYSFANQTIPFNAEFNGEYTEGVLYAERLNGETIFGTITYTEDLSFEVGDYLASLEETTQSGEYTYSITVPPKLNTEEQPEKLTPTGEAGAVTCDSSELSSKSNWEYEWEHEDLEIGLVAGTKTKLLPDEAHTVFMQIPLAGVELWYGTWNESFVLYGGFTVNNTPTTLIIEGDDDFLDEYDEYISDLITGLDHGEAPLDSINDVLMHASL